MGALLMGSSFMSIVEHISAGQGAPKQAIDADASEH